MTPAEVLNEVEYKVMISTVETDHEEGIKGFIVTFPTRVLANLPPAPVIVNYNCYNDDCVLTATDYEDDREESEHYSVPTYAHRILVSADVAQHCIEHGFHIALIDYDTDFNSYITDDVTKRKEETLREIMDDHDYRNTWKARRAAKKAGVLEGFKALFKFFKARGVSI